ncbi:unnamed protein product [Brassica oleracea var. botrytis]
MFCLRLKRTSSFKGVGEGERDRSARVSAAFLALRRWSLGREHVLYTCYTCD